MREISPLLPVIGLFVWPAERAGAVTRHVPGEFATIQAGLDASALGDTVLVAPGTYTDSQIRMDGPFTLRSCVYMVNGVALRSEAGPEVTTIDMLGAGVGAIATVIRVAVGPASGEILVEGFTVTGAPPSYGGAFVASAVTFRDCIFRDMDGRPSSGGGIAANGDMDVIECEFVNCLGDAGGAIYHANGHLNLIGTTIRECGSKGVYLSGNAGGPGESALIEDCVFLDNWADVASGALQISQYNLGATVRRCRFEGNVAYGSGAGGLGWGNYGAKLIEDCLFLNNATSTGNGQGGALRVSGNGSCVIRGNTFCGNSQTYEFFGGATAYIATSALFERNIVSGSRGNTAVFVEEGGSLSTNCNVYWDNEDGNGVPLGATDREANPEFCDPDNHDFTVRENSPCVEPGSLGCGQIGAFGIGCGVVSVESASWGRIKALHREGERP